MKAVVINDFGGREQLKLSDVSTPKITKNNEVLIEIAYSGVNPIDWKLRMGFLRDMIPHKFPLILGWEASGIIKETGKDVRHLKVGDEVYAYCRKPEVQWGTYAEFITLDADHVALKPKNLSHRESAGVPLAGLTAWQSLFNFADLKSGESVLIHAGAGGVGSYAVQFSKSVGAKVYTTAREENHSYLKALGADVVIDYRKNDFVSVIRDFEPNGLDVILDSIGGVNEALSFSVLKNSGRLASIVNFQAAAPSNRKDLKVGFVFVEPSRKDLELIARLFEDNKIKPPQIEELNLSQASAAHEKSENSHVRGKLVLKVK